MASGRVSKAEGSITRTLGVSVGLVGLIAAVLLTVWCWGAAAATAVGQPAPARFNEGPLILVRLMFHLGDPGHAWGSRGGAELPGPAVMWSILVVLVLAWTIAAAVVARVARQRGLLRPREGWARWATAADLRELRVEVGAHPGRLALGTFGGRLLAADSESSVLAVMPPRSGKTAGLVLPALLEWDGPVIATSIRDDLLGALERRKEFGEVAIFDPTGATGLPADGWSPVAASRTWQGARQTAALMVEDGASANAGGGDSKHWEDMARRFLSGLLFAAAQGRHTMRDVLRWVETFESLAPTEALATADDRAAASRARDVLEAMWEMDGKTMWSLKQTTANALDPYEDPRTLEAEERAIITPEWLLEGANTLFIVSPQRDQARLCGLFVALLTSMIAGAAAKSMKLGGPLTQHLLLALDECANVAPLPDLDKIASTCGGMGIQLLTIFQSRAQAADRWGQHRADAIMAAHRAQFYGPGLADEASLNYLRSVLGEEEVQQVAHSSGGTSSHTSRSTTWRPLVDGPAAREAAAGTGLLIYGNRPPARLALRMWFDDPRLRRLALGAASATT